MYRLLSIATTAIVATALAACIPDAPDPSDDNPGADAGAVDPGASARQLYDDGVQSPVEARCQNCHVEGSGPDTALKFLGATTGANYYNDIIQYPEVTGGFDVSIATFLTKGPHSGSTWWDAAEETAVRAWLGKELIEREDDPKPDPAGFSAFSGCMTQANWDAANMAIWGNGVSASNGTGCDGCHADGQAQFFASGDPLETFDRNRHEIFIKGFFKSAAGGGVEPDFDGLVYIGSGQHEFHPLYNVSMQSPHMMALQAFYDATVNEMMTTDCESTGFPPVGGP